MLVSNANHELSNVDDGLPNSVKSLSQALEQFIVRLRECLDVPSDATPGQRELSAKDYRTLNKLLEELQSAFELSGSAASAKLVAAIASSLCKVEQADVAMSFKQRQAIIECAYLLPRYLDFVAEQDGASEQPLLLSSCFYKLAGAGLVPFVTEHELSDFGFKLKQALPSMQVQDEPGSMRRLRQMYQIGLIGLLQNKEANSQLLLINHVVERVLALESEADGQLLWHLFAESLRAIEDGSLSLTPQRRHFFSRFDRHLRAFERQQAVDFENQTNIDTLQELCFMLTLSGRYEWLCEQLQVYAEITPLFYTDADIVAQSEIMERGVDQAIAAVCAEVSSQLGVIKNRLGVMSESQLCEENDQAYIKAMLTEVTTVLKFCGFELLTSPLQHALRHIDSWSTDFPEERELMEVANAILYIENAMYGFAMPGTTLEDDDDSIEAIAEQSVVECAKHVLYSEMQASIALSKRSISDYNESAFENKHIANLGSNFSSLAGGFILSRQAKGAALMQSCSALVKQITQAEIEADRKNLPILVDSLLAIDYLLRELAAGRKIQPNLEQLLDESQQAANSALA